MPRSSCTTTRPTRPALAAIGELPNLVHQNSSILADELVLVTDYDGEVDKPTLGAELAEHIGDASVALLVSHGVIVTAPTIEEAVYKSVLFERTCMLDWLVRAMDRSPIPIAPAHQKQLKASLVERAAPVYWHGVVRTLAARRARRVGVAMAIPLEELQAKQGFTTATAGEVTWLPEPERAARRYTVISVDDHIVEPPDAFAGRLPAKLADARAARRRARRRQRGVGLRGAGAAQRRASTRSSAGRSTEYSFEPTRFDEMRRGAWDIRARIADMDVERRVRVGVLPVVPARVRGPAAPAAHRRSRARARLRAGVERLGDRRRGRRTRRDA